VTFVACNEVDFTHFDFACQLHRLFLTTMPSQLGRHRLGVTDRQIEFRCDLLIGQVQAHEVQTPYPDPQRLMVAFKHCPTQIVKLPSAGLALVPLAMSLVGVKPTLVNVTRLTIWATNSIRPAQLPDHFEAFCLINQVLNV